MRLSLLVIPALLVVGCGGGTKKTTPMPDLSVAMKADMTVSDNCAQVTTWPKGNVHAFSDVVEQGFPYIDGVFDAEPNATTPAHHDELLYRYYQQSGQPQPQVPHDYDIQDTDTFGTCFDCVTALLDYDPNDTTTTPGTFYFATSGSIHVSKLDHGSVTGTVAATGTMLHLVHWDYDYTTSPVTDQADPDGKCIDVASFDFSAMFDNTPTDGGVDM